MFNHKLKWKEFNINMNMVQNWIKENLATEIHGISANSACEIHFKEEPSEAELVLLGEYWDIINEESEEATSYKSGEQVAAEEQEAQLELKESAKTKLAALGLSDAEIKAIIGV